MGSATRNDDSILSAAHARSAGGFLRPSSLAAAPLHGPIALAALLALTALALAAGQLGPLEAAAVGAGIGVVLATRALAGDAGLRLLLGACHYAALLGLCVALLQGEQRGTHRWLSVLGLDLPVALALSLMTPLHLAADERSRRRRVTSCLALVLLAASASYTLTGVCAVACAAAASWRSRRVALCAIALVAVGLWLAALNNHNRVRRVVEFYGASSSAQFQVVQARATLHSLALTGAAAEREHLPCATTDFALLDLGRRRGVLAMGAWLAAQMGLLAAAVLLARRCARDATPTIQAAATLVLACAIGHLGVCVGALPPAGVPAAFTGASGSSWLAFGFLLAYVAAVARPARGERLNTTIDWQLRLAPALLLAAASVAIFLGASLESHRPRGRGTVGESAWIGRAPSAHVDVGAAIARGVGDTDVAIELQTPAHVAHLPSDLARLLVEFDRRARLGRVQVTCVCGQCRGADGAPEPASERAPLTARVALRREPSPSAADELTLPQDRPLAFVAQDVLAYLEPELGSD